MHDDMSRFAGRHNVFTTFGEVMIRETPADMERLERTRNVYLSPAGSEFTVAVGLSRLGIPSTYVTRLPENPSGWSLRNSAMENGVNADYFVWAPKTELVGRMLYEMGRTPRKSSVCYQRRYSAASRLDQGMVDWKGALEGARLFHTSGITFGLSTHSGYHINYNQRAFLEAVQARSPDCLVGLDINYRSTLWGIGKARSILGDIIGEHVDILITTIPDMVGLFGIPFGSYSAGEALNGEMRNINNDDILQFSMMICRRFDVKIVAIPLRHPESLETHHWESVVADHEGHFFRSPAVHPIMLLDRLGGGDSWTAGFYYGLLTNGFNPQGMQKGLMVGDALARYKQTMMFDLPIFEKSEIGRLMEDDLVGVGKQVDR